ncbi:helix-turn-helix domain-containing protein [Roseivirga sp. E12]|uniref:helix-turn-helix domain-containing protein n=1 Tax=Roseivirga sp. E12 TaxID=2819237 RepID=UPI001ABC9700|nr:helix-turn-helix domain-containing protein [Roseivirga sp. E12]MBO3699895.1 helix-turn-helix domain-containing protein [Roseivirga sp. E12]
MSNFLNIESDFLDKTILKIQENLSDEGFGVSELAESLDMSRSNLLRKVQKLTDMSVSVLIRQTRLHHAQEFLRSDELTVSEVSYKVGFNSVSYFTKCYREHYGYPPGEERPKFLESKSNPPKDDSHNVVSKRWLVPIAVMLVIVLAIIFFPKQEQSRNPSLEKSIAVLPFKNDSNDSSNIYIVNGLMEAVLNNLQKIENLRVVSRTSVESYRDNAKSIGEIAEELNADYIVEGSGQKVGDQILLTIQLIEAPKDDHLWSEQYQRSSSNIFELQAEVAKDIAQRIEVYISPDEIRRIEKLPTENALAYDYFLRGLTILNEIFGSDLDQALDYFKKSVEEDPNFALGYAHMAICYYYLDLYAAEKQFAREISELSDRALFLDPELFASQVAKGLFYMQDRQYTLAIEYFEKALNFSPNAVSAHNFLSEIYNVYLPNTRRYLTHALKAIRLDNTNIDSTLTSISFLHLSNALAQTGFFDEAEAFAEKSIALDSTNLFSQYLYPYIKMAQGNDLQTTVGLVKEVLNKDTTRLDIIQEVAKLYYTMERYEEAAFYYDVFNTIKAQYGLNIFDGESIKIAYIYDQLGREEEAKEQMKIYYAYAQNDNSIYKDLMFSSYYAYMGDIEEAIEYLKKFSEQRDYFYWLVMMMKDDPIMKPLQVHPDYAPTMKKIDDQFWEDHKATRKMLEEEGLIQSTFRQSRF